jgi:hypothetical protein
VIRKRRRRKEEEGGRESNKEGREKMEGARRRAMKE